MKNFDENEKTNERKIEVQSPQKISKNDLHSFKIRFHIFIPSEFNFDENDGQIGIISNLNKYNMKEMIVFDNIRKFNNGYLAIKDYEISMDQAEKIKFNFEYKYSIKTKKDNETFAEELNKHNNFDDRIIHLSKLRNLTDQNINKYDGLMMLPDNLAKRICSKDNLNKKDYLEQTLQAFFYKFNKDEDEKIMFESFIRTNKLLGQTLQAMFYQLNKDEDERIMFESLDQAIKYLSDIYQDMRFYFLDKRQYNVDHLIGNFFRILLKIFESNDIQNLNLIIAVLILANKELKNRSYNPKDWFFYLLDSINKYEPEKLFECLNKNNDIITSTCKELLNNYKNEPSSMNLIELAFSTNFKKSENNYNLFINPSKNEINLNFVNFFEQFFQTVDILSEDSAVEFSNLSFNLDSIIINLVYLPSFINSDKIQIDKILNLLSIEKFLYIIAGSIQNSKCLDLVLGVNNQKVTNIKYT